MSGISGVGSRGQVPVKKDGTILASLKSRTTAFLHSISVRCSAIEVHAKDLLDARMRVSEIDNTKDFIGCLNAVSVDPRRSGKAREARLLTFIGVWNATHKEPMQIKVSVFSGSSLPKVAGSKDKTFETYWFSDKPVSLGNAPVVYYLTVPKRSAWK